MLTVKDVANELRIHPNTVYRLVHAGKLKAVKVGGAIRIYEDDLAKFIERGRVS